MILILWLSDQHNCCKLVPLFVYISVSLYACMHKHTHTHTHMHICSKQPVSWKEKTAIAPTRNCRGLWWFHITFSTSPWTDQLLWQASALLQSNTLTVLYTHTHTHTHTHIHTHTHTHTHTHIHKDAHTHTHMHTHTYLVTQFHTVHQFWSKHI